MNPISLTAVAANCPIAAVSHAPGEAAKITDAARQFEALLLAQILRSERESGNGWLGSGEDKASDCATELGEQQLALQLAQQGGLGMASLIASGLKSHP